jgi:hypothetical protein
MTEGRKRGAQHRSRITNGSALLPSVHGQSVWARIMRDVLDAVTEHCGGEQAISELERLQARRIAALEAEAVYLEDRIAQARAAGEEPPSSVVDLYTRVANGQRRRCEALGWKRTPRDVTPDLHEYLAGKAAGSEGD